MLNDVPNVVRRRSCHCAIEIFLGRYGSPAVENLTRLINYQHTGLKKPFWMLNFPVGTALQELGFSAAGIERQPVALVTNTRDLLVRVSDVFEI